MTSTIFRSEEMSLCQIYFKLEDAYSCVAELGELGIAQFRDLNPNVNAFQRRFVNEVRRCEEMERRLRFLEGEIKKDSIPIVELNENIRAPLPPQMAILEETIEICEKQLKEVNTGADGLTKKFNELTEMKYVLAMMQNFSNEAGDARVTLTTTDDVDNFDGEKLATTWTREAKLGCITGVISRERRVIFERTLWRICRGNVYLRYHDFPDEIIDPSTGNPVEKTAFVIFYQGDQLRTRVRKICDGFRANTYDCPEDIDERNQVVLGVMTRLEDINTIITQTNDQRQMLLANVSKTLQTWQMQVLKMKSIFTIMNMFNNDLAKKCFIAECWIPNTEIRNAQAALTSRSENGQISSLQSILNKIEHHEQPPTFHRLNKVTQGFQNLVDAYGVATYREINPMPFVVITFPFLFAVMFGDAGHGTIVALFALWMILKEKQLENRGKTQEVWRIFFGGRYIIFLMGIFSIYTGLIYNDIFSKSVNIFGSAWRVKFDDDYLNKESNVILEPTPFNYSKTKDYQQMYSGNPYPFGFDPIWQLSVNKITFTNSAKMKFAIIIGICQMGFGVFLSLGNHLHFKHRYAIFLEFLPQLIFLASIFFYLIIMILYKWTHFQGIDSGDAPSLLIHLINMMLLSYPTTPKSSVTFYNNQKTIQTILLLIAVLCIPWMLLGKPIYRIVLNRRKARASTVATNHTSSNDIEMQSHDQHEERRFINHDESVAIDDTDEHHHHSEKSIEVDMSEVWVEQGIHTIEYFLGCISHTASYLRLWALSLAHAQLSEVLWNMVLKIGFGMNGYLGGIALFIVFMPWSTLTVGILLLMEGLSAFLHALRLHWVEFQSKFYKGEGYPFVPFSFRLILEEIPKESS